MPTVIVWGPPCSGKTTHIEQRIQPGDVVVDLDRLALAIAAPGTQHHGYPGHVRRMAQAARRAILDDVVAWGIASPHTAWVIDSNADHVTRAKWRRRGATIVKLDVGYDECVRRAIDARPPSCIDAIDSWFARHAAPNARSTAASRRWG